MMRKIVLFFGFWLGGLLAVAQNTDSLGIHFQSVARNASGTALINQNISLRFGIYQNGAGGTLLWQETHSVNSGSLGVFSVIIGKGQSTSAGTLNSFHNINWADGYKVALLETDMAGGTNFTIIDTLELQAVPYAFHSSTANKLISYPRVHELTDVDTSGIQTDYILKWNGFNWTAATDEKGDTAIYAYNSYHAQTADTAQYALSLINPCDSVNFSFYSDSAQFAQYAATSAASTNAVYTDTANVALNCILSGTAWMQYGNTGTNPGTDFLGTIDNKDLLFKTNNLERMRITAAGKIGVGTNNPSGAMEVSTDYPVLFTPRTSASLPVSVTGAGRRFFWYPGKNAFRAGEASGAQFDDLNIGLYSFATGYDVVARGDYSFSAGQQTTAYGNYSTSLGFGNIANGNSSFAAGSANTANGHYSIAIGRGGLAADSSSMAIGYHCNATGKYSLAFGFENNASGDYSITMGHHASTAGQTGSFVFADASTATYATSTASNQFLVRASGGYFFYSNSTLTAGVVLAAGGGSWSSVSDANKKKNIREVNSVAILKKLRDLPVYTWNYKSQPDSIRHMGPMAQDFYACFGLGESDTLISAVDIDGINMAALKGLEERTADYARKTRELQEVKKELNNLQAQGNALDERIKRLEQLLEKKIATSDK